MELIFYPDHDVRYAHIPKRERKLYPDEIVFGGFFGATIKREKNWEDLTWEDVGDNVRNGISWVFHAKDRPYTEGLIRP